MEGLIEELEDLFEELASGRVKIGQNLFYDLFDFGVKIDDKVFKGHSVFVVHILVVVDNLS